MKKARDYEISSGNIFADLGLSNPEERLTKAELARQINNLIKQKNLTQKEVATLFQIDSQKMVFLSNGNLSTFSSDMLFNFLALIEAYHA